MGDKIRINGVAGLIFAGILLAGLIYGCYSREGVPEDKTAYGRDFKPSPLSEAELRKFANSIRKVDGEAEAHYRLALHFQEKYRHKLAIDELKQVLLRDPAHAKAYNALGVSFDNLGDHDAAIDYYRLALQIDSKLDYVFNNLGYSCLLKGDIQKAVEAFQNAIALSPNEKRFRNNLGLAYVRQSKYELAYEQFSALDSEANARKTLARVMTDLGKGSETETVLLAVKSAPKKEEIAKPSQPAPASKLPELSARGPETSSGYDPVARFRSVKQNLNVPPDEEIQDAAEQPEGSGNADMAEEASGEEEENLVAETTEEPLKGPVINIPAPPAQPKSYEIKVASAPQYYHVASITLSRDAKEPVQAAPVAQKIDYQEKPVKRIPREVLPTQVEILSPMDQEKHEEQILVAASSIKAGGWQNPPEPKRTAEKGIVEVEVANGNGVKGAAGRVAEHLRRCGFKVVRVMDAQSHDHFSTKVFYYGGNLNEAQRLLKAIPEISADAELYELESMGNHLRLLIGKDLLERNNTLTWEKPRSMKSRIGG
jgi:tetratricopeptide (TPR) repeat protein